MEALHASDAKMALKMQEMYTHVAMKALAFGQVSAQITASNPDENGEMFEPAADVYRHPTFYVLPDEPKTHVIEVGFTAESTRFNCP